MLKENRARQAGKMESLRVACVSNSVAFGGMEVYLVTLSRILGEMESLDEKIAITVTCILNYLVVKEPFF